jgi:hypothetical protein
VPCAVLPLPCPALPCRATLCSFLPCPALRCSVLFCASLPFFYLTYPAFFCPVLRYFHDKTAQNRVEQAKHRTEKKNAKYKSHYSSGVDKHRDLI